MPNDWDIPKWRKEGRTGPGPVAPRYANRKDRATVRKGGTPGGPPKKGGCCPTMAAVRSARRGQFRLARRYAAMAVRLMVARIV